MEQSEILIDTEVTEQPEQSLEKESEIKPTRQPIDVITAYQKGNFGPAIVCLKNQWLKMDIFDENGYNILHHATCYNEQSMLLVEYFGMSPQLLAKNGQTNAMISANFGYIELLKYYLDKNVDIDAKDNANFDALLYACKSNYITCFFYLLYKGSKLTVVDQNGCGVVHWAAYRDNLFFLRIFKTFGLDLNLKDNNGFTPFQRAIQNESYDSIEFYCEEYGLEILPESLDLTKIESPYIKQYLNKKLDEKRNYTPFWDLEGHFWKIYIKKPRFFITMFYLFSIIANYYSFYTGIYSMPVNQRGDYFWSDIIFNLITLYFLGFLVLFIWCIRTALSKTMKTQNFKYQQLHDEGFEFKKNDDIMQGFQNVNLEEIKYLNFENLDNLMKNIKNQQNLLTNSNELLSVSETEQQYTFLHYLAYLIETHQFITAQSVDYLRYCPTCISYKPPKTKHCKACNICVPYFNHHSFIFNKCINNTNHLPYVTLLIVQQIWLLISIYLQISALNSQRTSWNLLLFAEIAFIIKQNFGIVNCIIYALTGIGCFYNTLFLTIEFCGICLNQTYNEIFNRTRYRYLYEPYIDKKGKVWNRYVNKTSLGLLGNIRLYFRRAFNL